MDILERLNAAVVYIEANLCGEIDMNELHFNQGSKGYGS